jgi:hypothetical protein
LREQWKMVKTKHGNVFISVSEVKLHKVGKKYKRGRIQITVDPEWIGYTAMVTLSKIKTPKFKVNVNEIDIEKLRDIDPSDLAEIVFETKSDKPPIRKN